MPTRKKPTLEQRLAAVEGVLGLNQAPPAPLRPSGKRPSLLFITPAHKRVELTKLCLEERRWVCEVLDQAGVDATAVVVACDENLETARELGFLTVERDNRYLGRRWNDGHELAVREGFDYVFPVGSDSWVDPLLFIALAARLPKPDSVLCTRYYAVVHSSGLRRTTIRIDKSFGVGFCIPTELLKLVDGRPCGEQLPRGCDTSTLGAIEEACPGLLLTFQEYHPLEYVAFQSGRTQITGYDKLHRRWRGIETRLPFDDLAAHYPPHLVERMRAYYASGTPATV